MTETMAAPTGTAGAPEPGGPAPTTPVARWLVRAVVLAGVAFGIALRLWFLFHVPVNSDEAIVGLMARGIEHGHFAAFYWGQPYGGGEPYVVAPLFALFGQSALVLALTPVLLWAVSSVLVWRIVRRLVATPELALLAGALVWVGPNAALFNSTLEYGFRGVTLVCGLTALLMALRVLDDQLTWVNAAVLGLAAGVGWWSSPEIAYDAVPAGLIVLAALVQQRHQARRWLSRLAVGLGAAAVGALPWIWANVRSDLASLRSSSFPGGALTQLNTGFGGRFDVFFRRAFLIDLDLRHLGTGEPVIGGTGGTVLAVVLVSMVVAAVLVCLARRDRVSAIGVALVVFPLIYAAQPGTWFWADGRYIVFLSPLLAMALVASIEPLLGVARAVSMRRAAHATGPRRASPAMALGGAVVLVAVLLTAVAFGRDNAVTVNSFASNWSNPNGPVDRSIAVLEAHGVRAGYADYWVAYKIDLLARGALTVTPAPGDVDRSAAIDAQVAHAPHQAWLFVPGPQLGTGYVQFSGSPVIVGPRAVTPTLFLVALGHLGIGYRTIPAGLLTAIVPDLNVTIYQVLAAGG
jgi:hypothetical protein